MSIPVEDQLKSLSDSLTDMWIAGLENSVFQDIHVSALIRMGEEAIPRLQFYLTSQAELERDLVADLEKYYTDKRELEDGSSMERFKRECGCLNFEYKQNGGN